MGGISLTVHPLFYIFGLYYALTGKIFVFVIYTICAVLHEVGHSLAASAAGYRLNKIVLMPFGAVAKGDIEGLKLIDEIKIALAGPFLSLAVGLFFVAVWWICPELYAYTDIAAEANFSMALVNFLPVFPLDGGRVLSAFTTLKFGKKASSIICKITGVVFALLLILSFFLTLENLNVSLLFFSMFVLFGAFGKGAKNGYIKLYSAVSENRLKRGVMVKRQAVDKSVTVKKVMSILDENALNEIDVYENGEKLLTLTQTQINNIILSADLYSAIEYYL